MTLLSFNEHEGVNEFGEDFDNIDCSKSKLRFKLPWNKNKTTSIEDYLLSKVTITDFIVTGFSDWSLRIKQTNPGTGSMKLAYIPS